MRGSRAKAIRQRIYGVGMSSRVRQWRSSFKPQAGVLPVKDRLGRIIGEAFRRWWTGTVTADPQRRIYQAIKRSRRGMSWRAAGRLA